ncbi:hypothetical protein ZYGR_0AG00360 [Zygosaccharomyces rouxii]|uniref:Uncharacterized protein n=1 Tax=Zygosaccharomyces rouxii TaxID=4956 RepID=A0A1Q3A8H4_ZYGRO|nr:hypothetical protein ZYGR_0AG00360 [Zygosaccharomyces rouxii]
MPVVKKRRTHHAKSSRIHHQVQLQQQQQLQVKQRFENSRLRPEHVSAVSHDESDTVSYRSHLLKNFIKTAEFIDVLTTQLVPLDKIKPPEIFKGITPSQLEGKLQVQKESVSQLQEMLNGFEWKLDENSGFLKDKLWSVESNSQDLDEILNQYESKFGLRSQENRVVTHRGKYTHLQKDQSCAPDGYWSNYAKLKKEHKERKLQLQWEQEQERQRQEQEKRVQEEEELRRKEEEQHYLEQQQREREQQEQEQFQRQQLEQQEEQQQEEQPQNIEDQHQDEQFQDGPSDSQQDEQSPDDDSKAQVPQSQQQNSNQNMMDSMFGDFGNEPFNNGFEDEFGDIDTAFF